MPSLKAIRTRITSVKNTQKITRAMKLIAAARLRKAQDSLVAARPYARAMERVVAEVSARAGGAHKLLEARTPHGQKKVEVVALTGDRGLAGGFNSYINRTTERFVVDGKAANKDVTVSVVGRKGRENFRRRKLKMGKEWPGVTSPTALERAREIALYVVQRYLDGEVDEVWLVYNEFKSAISQKVQTIRLLPIEPRQLLGGGGDFVYEPSETDVLDTLLPLYVQSQIMRALLETIASFFGAQMSAMDNATKNASEMIAKLTLQYNRARQAAITKELLEIIGGAEALKG